MSGFASAAEFYRAVGMAPGESPFLVRGNTYVFHREYVREHLPGGEAAQREALGELGAHPFFDTLFLANGWYDVFPLVAFGYACAEADGSSFESFVAARAEDQVVKDLRFFRRMLVKLSSPRAVAVRLPGISASYFDFATVDSVDIGDDRATSVMTGVPELLAPWMSLTSSRFIEHVMGVNGARDLDVRVDATPAGDGPQGVSIVSLAFDIRWNS